MKTGNSTVASLAAEKNGVTGHGELLDVIAAIGQNGSTIASINMSLCPFGTDAAAALANALTPQPVNPANAASAPEVVVQHIRLVGCSLKAAALDALSGIGALERLEVLELAENPFGDDGAPAVAKILQDGCSTLKALDLSSCGLTVGGVKALAVPLSKGAGLSAAAIPSSAPETFSKYMRPSAGAAQAAASKLISPTANVLAVNQPMTLRTLLLCNNNLRSGGVTVLCQALRLNRSVVNLDVSGNCINADGGSELAALLRQNTTIECLSASANYLGTSVAHILAAASAATGRPPMRLLDVGDNHVDDDVCRNAARLLEGAKLNVVCFAINANPIGDDGFVALFHALRQTTIQFLDVSNMRLTSHSGVVIADMLAQTPTLNSLHVDGNDLGDDALAEIVRGMFSMQGPSGAAGGASLVTALNVERTGLGPKALQRLAAKIDGRSTLLQTNTSLSSVSASKRASTPAVMGTTRLRNLTIADNKDVDADSALALLHALNISCSTLELLDMSHLPQVPETEELLGALITLFASNPSLATVRLEATPLGQSLPNGLMTRETVAQLRTTEADASISVVSGSVSRIHAKGATMADDTARTLAHRPAWAVAATHPVSNSSVRRQGPRSRAPGASISRSRTLTATSAGDGSSLSVVFGGGDDADDIDAEDLNNMPYEPNPTSLMHPLYPTSGGGRFSNAAAVQTLSNPVPYNVQNSKGLPPPLVTTGDCADLFYQAPRRPLQHSLYSLEVLERNVGHLPVTEEQLRRKFNELDTDGSGLLDRQEFRVFYKSLQGFGVPHSDKEVDRVFDRYCNLHGDPNKINFQEFSLVMLNFAQR